MGKLSMSDPRLTAANRIIAAQNRVLAKAYAALRDVNHNGAVADEQLRIVRAAIAELEGHTSPDDESLDQTLATVFHIMAEG
jgi:hypothetical protein